MATRSDDTLAEKKQSPATQGMECYALAKRIVMMQKLGATLPAVLKLLKISNSEYQLLIPAVTTLQLANDTKVPPPQSFPFVLSSK
jgi:hypothetical protein